MADDRKPSVFSLYLGQQRHNRVAAPGGSLLVTGRTVKGHVGADTIADCKPDPAPEKDKARVPTGAAHLSAERSFLRE